MAREDLISSAVSFLKDPSVASSPVEKRVAFLQSKHLTQEEIDKALRQAGQSLPPGSTATSISQPQRSIQQRYNYGYQQPQMNRQPPPPPYSQGGVVYSPSWDRVPEPPRRDWRDWFIMATVTGGVSYGLYVLIKRYVMPLIAPPTPPQIAQDKAEIDAQFARAFALIDQVATDTSALKSAEEDRTVRLDTAVSTLEKAIEQLRSTVRQRGLENNRIETEVRTLKEGLQNALAGVRDKQEHRLSELRGEMKSLKVLVGSRVGSTAAPAVTAGAASAVNASSSVTSAGSPGSPTHIAIRPRYVVRNIGTNGAEVAAGSVDGETKPTSPARAAGSAAMGRAVFVHSPPIAIPSWQMLSDESMKAETEAEELNANANANANTNEDNTSGSVGAA